MPRIAIPGGASPSTPILDAPLDHIDLQRSTLNILVDGTGSNVATLKTAGGRTIPGDVDTWEVDNPAIATVDAETGVYTFVSLGTTLGRATKDAVDSPDFVVACVEAVGGDEEPVGMTFLNFQPFNEEIPDGWLNVGPLQDANQWSTGYTVVNDPTSPGTGPESEGAPNVGEFRTVAYAWQGTLGSSDDSTHITFPSDASAVDDTYNGLIVSLWGPGSHQRNQILDYVGSTRRATIEAYGLDSSSTGTWDPVPQAGDTAAISVMRPGSGAGGRIDVYAGPGVGSMPFYPTKLYWCGWFKVNADFQIVHGDDLTGTSPVQKFVESGTDANYYNRDSPAFHMPEWINAGDPNDSQAIIQPWSVIVRAQYVDGGGGECGEGAIDGPFCNFTLGQNENLGVSIPRGEWFFAQTLWTMNTPGNGDGSFQHWLTIDGVKYRTHNYPAIQAESPLGTMSRFSHWNIQTTYGGHGAPITEDNYLWVDDLYISGGYVAPGNEPTHWQITAYPGNTVAAGQAVQVVAQLLDDDNIGVNTFGPSTTFQLTGGATQSGGPWIPYTFETTQTTPTASGQIRVLSTQLSMTFDTATGTPTDAGDLRFNNGTIGSVTHVYVSTTDRNAASILSSLQSIGVGTLRVTNESNGSELSFTVTGADTGGSGATAYYDFTVTGPTGTIPANGTNCTVSAAGLVTHVYVSDLDQDGADMSGLLDLFDIQGKLRITRFPDTEYVEAIISAITTGGSGATAYHDFTVVAPAGYLPSDAQDTTLTCTLHEGRAAIVVHIPGDADPLDTFNVTCSDHAKIANGQNGIERTSNTLVLTVA